MLPSTVDLLFSSTVLIKYSRCKCIITHEQIRNDSSRGIRFKLFFEIQLHYMYSVFWITVLDNSVSPLYYVCLTTYCKVINLLCLNWLHLSQSNVEQSVILIIHFLVSKSLLLLYVSNIYLLFLYGFAVVSATEVSLSVSFQIISKNK